MSRRYGDNSTAPSDDGYAYSQLNKMLNQSRRQRLAAASASNKRRSSAARQAVLRADRCRVFASLITLIQIFLILGSVVVFFVLVRGMNGGQPSNPPPPTNNNSTQPPSTNTTLPGSGNSTASGPTIYTLTHELLQAPVSIKRSSDGIVYINAQYDADMLFARGWVMAEDRLGQLCMYRRIARGTLSSVLGVTAYPTDVFFRTVNFRQKAIEEWNRLPEDIRTAITHTIDGINAFIVERNKTATPAQMRGDAANAWSPELLILGQAPPDLFQPVDMVGNDLMIQYVEGNNQDWEMARLLLLFKGFTLERIMELYPSGYNPSIFNSTGLTLKDLGLNTLSQEEIDGNIAAETDNSGAFVLHPLQQWGMGSWPFPVVDVTSGMPTAEAIAANLTSVLADIQALSEGGTSSLSKRSSSRRKHHLVQDSENEYLSNSAGIALPENGIRDDLTFGMLFGENLASNIILINGNLTASKKGALIGNDPHMSAESPGFYWLGSMRSEESGFEASGLFAYCSSWPVSGRNKHHSWGITSSMADSVDLYVMVDVPLNSSNPTGPKGYLYNGTVLSYVERIEIIQVFDLNTQTMTQSTYKVLETVYGPVVNTLYGLPGNAPKISMRMTSIASEGVHSYNYIAQLASNAENWGEFRDGIRQIDCAPLNLGYADKEGNIGYMLAGTYPKRKRGHTGAFAVLGTGQWDWQGFAEDEEKPSAFNMEKGYFVETNFRVVPVGFPHVLGGDYGSYQRQKRAIEIIEYALATSGPTLTTDLLKQIQLDSKSLYFVDSLKKSVLPLIVNSIDPSNAQLLNKLLNWDGVFRYGAVEPTLSEGMRLQLGNLVTKTVGVPQTLADTTTNLIAKDDILCRQVPVFITGQTPYTSCKEFASKAFDSLVSLLVNTYGQVARWGVDGLVGQVVIGNTVLSPNPQYQVRATITAPHLGGWQSLNVGSKMGAVPAMYLTFIPTGRIVYANEPGTEQAIVSGGNSGDVRSVFYKNMMNMFQAGQYYNMCPSTIGGWNTTVTSTTAYTETILQP